MQRQSLVINIILAVCLTACGTQEPITPSAKQEIPVTIISPLAQDITTYIESLGTLLPSVSIEIRPQVSGTLIEVLVKEGERVQKNRPLFKIDPKIYEIKLKEAEAQLAIDTATLIATEKKLARFRELAEKDLVAQTEWDDLIAQAEKAKAAVNIDEARIAAAQIELDHCTLIAPIDGRIGKLDAHPGILVSPSNAAPLATIAKLDPLLIEFTITEKEYPQLTAETTSIEIQPLCSTELCKEAQITFLDNHFDKKTGLMLIRGKVANTKDQMRPGQSLRVKIPISTEENALLIPHKTVRFNQDGPYVFIIQDDMTVVQRTIKIGAERGDLVIVNEGLTQEDKIVQDGHMRVSPGSKVTIKS